MKRLLVLSLIILVACTLEAQQSTYASLRLRDSRNKHPHVESITFPGNSVWREAYDAIWGHGGMIENPWAGFRVYMNEGQAIDLYLKQNPGLELEKTSFYSTPDDVASGLGCDVLRVGSSLGCGAFRGWDGANTVSINPVDSRTQCVTDSATLRVVCRGWQYGGHKVDVTETYTVRPDSPWLFVDVLVEGDEACNLTYCTGIQKLDAEASGRVDAAGYAESVGVNAPDTKKPELTEAVALAIQVEHENVAGTAETATDYVILVRPDSQGHIRYKVLGSRP